MYTKNKGYPSNRQNLLYLFVGMVIGGLVIGSLVALFQPRWDEANLPTPSAVPLEVLNPTNVYPQLVIPTSVPPLYGTVIANRLESIAIAPNGGALAVSTQNMGMGGVILQTFNVGNNLTGNTEPFDVPAMFSKMQFSPDGQWLVGSTRDGGSVGLYNVVERRLVQRFESYNAAAFSADGQTLLIGGMTSGIRLLEMSSGSPQLLEALSVAGYVYQVAVSPDNVTFAVVVSDAEGATSVQIYSRLDLQAPPRVFQLRDYVMDLAYHPSGQLLALASGYNLQIFDLASGSQRLFTLPEMTQIRTIAFNQTGNWLAAGGGNGGDGSGGLIYAWRWDESGILRPDEQWLEQRVLSGHNHIVTSLAFMPNFGGLVSASHDGSVRLWNFVEGIEISRWQM